MGDRSGAREVAISQVVAGPASYCHPYKTGARRGTRGTFLSLDLIGRHVAAILGFDE